MANCIEISYFYNDNKDNLRESKILLNEVDSESLLGEVVETSPLFKPDQTLSDFDGIVEFIIRASNDPNHYVHNESNTLLKNLNANKLKNLTYGPLHVAGKDKENLIFNLGTQNKTLDVEGLKSQIDKQAYSFLPAQSNFEILEPLLNKVEEVSKHNNHKLKFIETDGFLRKTVYSFDDFRETVIGLVLYQDGRSGEGMFIKSDTEPKILFHVDDMSEPFSIGDDAKNLSHELLHYLYEYSPLKNDPDIKTIGKDLLDEAKAFIKSQGFSPSAVDNVNEMIAYFNTEKEIANKLPKSLANKLVDYSVKLLQLEPNDLLPFFNLLNLTKVNPKEDNITNDEDQEDDIDETEKGDDDVPFRKNITKEVFAKHNKIYRTYPKEQALKAAKKIRENFNESIRYYKDKDGNKKPDYTVTFGNSEIVTEENRPKLFRLKQGDIVRVNVDFDDGTSKGIYAPIVYSFVNEKDELMFALASKKGNLWWVNESEVISYRENFGILRGGFNTTSQADLKAIHDEWKNLKQTKFNEETEKWEHTIPEDSIYKKITIGKGDKAFEKLITRYDKGIEISLDKDSYEETLFDDLQRGDYVKVVEKIKEGKNIEYYTPVVRVVGDSVETVLKLQNGDHVSKYIPKTYIKGAYLSKENHGDIEKKSIYELSKIATTGGFYKQQGIRRINFVNYNTDGSYRTDKKSWNDIGSIMEQIKKQGATLEEYSKWRTDLGEDELKKSKMVDYAGKQETFYKFYKALERRKHLTNNLKYGDFVLVDRPSMIKRDGEWEHDPNKEPKWSPAMVVSRSAGWLNVLVYKPNVTGDSEAGWDVDHENSKVYFKKIRINQPMPTVKNDKQVYSLRAVLFNHTEYEGLIRSFEQTKGSFKTNFDNKKEYFDLLKKGKSIPKELEYLAIPNRLEQKDIDDLASSDFRISYDGTGTKLADRYHITMFDKDITHSKRLRALAKVKRGSVLLLQSNVEGIPYTSNIVVDVNEKTGVPFIGFVNPKVNQISVVPIRPEEVVGIGYDMFGDIENNVEADEFYSEKLRSAIDSFKKLKERKYFPTLAKAEEWVKKKDKDEKVAKSEYLDIIYEEYVQKADGKIKKAKEGEKADLYVPRTINQYDIVEDFNDSPYWRKIYSKKIKSANNERLWNYLKIGDVLTRTWKGKDNNVWTDGVIISKTDTEIVTRTFKKNHKDDTWEYRDQIFFKFKADPFEDVVQVLLHKDNHSYKNFSKDLTYIAGKEVKEDNTQEKTPLKKKSRDSYRPGSVGKTSRTSKRATSKPVDASRIIPGKSNPIHFKKLKAFGDRLESIYGVEMQYLNTQEIKERHGDYYANLRAFVAGGEIIINSDYSSLAEPIHELGHLIMDGLKRTDPQLYNNIIIKAKDHGDYSKIASYYPGLDEEELSVEVFLTALGEYYNATSTIGENSMSFVNENQSWFTRVINKIKKWIGNLFGIDDRRFYTLDEYTIMNSSFDEILESFTANILNGAYLSEVEINNMKSTSILEDTFLKAPNDEDSKLYGELLLADFSKKQAESIWLKTKSKNFAIWHEGNLLEEDNEPKVFYRINDKEFTRTRTEFSDPVFIKSPVVKQGDNFKVLQSKQMISVYNADIQRNIPQLTSDVVEFAHNRGIKVIGSFLEMRQTIVKLKETFRDMTFNVETVGDNFYISYYKSFSPSTENLRNTLFNKNYIKMLC